MTLLVSFLQPRPALRGTDRPAFTSRKSAVLGAFQGLAVDNWEACQIRIRRLLIGGSPPLGTLCANREAYGIDAVRERRVCFIMITLELSTTKRKTEGISHISFKTRNPMPYTMKKQENQYIPRKFSSAFPIILQFIKFL
ncbi:hypothetical protein EYC84_008250 [Monilinia fructicola]|uniref:Uncharacterized protein n=1 Tax=Monilinia fructicola TaxID=38448 RepID=A0A5M9JDX4_MONFR|nr:hypothetical protein EYC84_008250 [Monilinia fructicola]